VTLLGQFHTYSDPHRDPRQHTITTVYVAQGHGQPQAADDARRLAIFAPEQFPPVLAFDHRLILEEYLKVRPQWLTKLKKSSEL
jgi:8-oxo-dGTP diphosphatase